MSRMPLIFIGHGSPMNAVEKNIYTESWGSIGERIEKPRAVLIFSAHWNTENETRISSNDMPEMIYDMYRFPPELYKVDYPARWDSNLAKRMSDILSTRDWEKKWKVILDPTRGLDHGIWSILIHMFPDADIPVIPISLDYHMSPYDLMGLGESLAWLRDKWILIIGSGNIVHNLTMIDWSSQRSYLWVTEFDRRISEGLMSGKGSAPWDNILDFKTWNISHLAHPSYDHLLPLFPLMGASHTSDVIQFYTPTIEMGSISMRSVVWG
jgi:4,5-DOPA dioxygenase extradiol